MVPKGLLDNKIIN